MAARVQQQPGDLIVVFSRPGERPESILCADGDRAAQHGVHLLAKHAPLRPGDLLLVRRDAEVGSYDDSNLPEASRSSHYS
jgi:hypothetical protein